VFDKDLALDLQDLQKQETYAVTTGQISTAPPVDTLVDKGLAVVR
jgi:hypothetical protein